MTIVIRWDERVDLGARIWHHGRTNVYVGQVIAVQVYVEVDTLEQTYLYTLQVNEIDTAALDNLYSAKGRGHLTQRLNAEGWIPGPRRH